MELSMEVKDGFQKHSLEGFIWVIEALPHQKPDKIGKQIDVEGISKATIQATIKLQFEGLHSIENPEIEILHE